MFHRTRTDFRLARACGKGRTKEQGVRRWEIQGNQLSACRGIVAALTGSFQKMHPNSNPFPPIPQQRLGPSGLSIASLVLGIIGIFLPLLPTVPFILLSAACFSRGSKRMHDWLVRLPFAGTAIDDYEKGRGVSRKSKATALFMMWTGMTISAIMLKLSPLVLAFLATIAVFATVIIVRLPKRRNP